MKINRHIHQTLRLKSFLVTSVLLLLIIAAAWLSLKYPARIDLSANANNTLSEASIKVLGKLGQPIRIQAFIREATLRQQIKQLLSRYQYVKPDIEIQFIDPTQSPEQAREHNIGAQGAVIVEYQGRSEKIHYLDETSLTNALLRLAESRERWITFLGGHGERSPSGQANFDLSLFGNELEKRGLRAQEINLTQLSAIPDNSSLLVLSDPAVDLLDGEMELIADYIGAGGNILLMTDPDNHSLDLFLMQLGITTLPGKIVDKRSSLYGIEDPTFVLVGEYPVHAVTQGFRNITVFPITVALAFEAEDNEYRAAPLLNSGKESWNETGPIVGKIRFDGDSDEREGPLDFAFALTRQLDDGKQQRIIVIGDGDFLSNAYLNNVGNLDLGLRMVNWLTNNDRFIDIPSKVVPGRTLQFSKPAIAMIGFGFLLLLPGLFLLAGILIWRKRRKQ
ncbi:GldG family protein [Methylomarinum vadi]|uniref:GldG family protein n=1 Tax=Methylomarinum vadi TaxID=438855 RepID=UPI0004DF292A|nr:GldG family protein [Methylomarinum vadi]